MSFPWPNKDPDEQLDYSVDWSRFLGSATISTVTWSVKSTAYSTKTTLGAGQTLTVASAGPTAIVNGAITSSTTLVLDSVVNLIVGMTLSQTSAGSISGAPVITAISGNTITLSVAQSLGDGVALGFRAYGPTLISKVFGLNIVFNNFIAIATQLTKTVRTDTTFPASDGAVTLNLNGTYGVAGASLVRITGFNINENANNNLVTSISASSTAGSVSVTFQGAADDVVSSVVPVGTKIYVNGSHQEIKITGTVVVNKYPETNAKLKLDLTKFITHGAATA